MRACINARSLRVWRRPPLIVSRGTNPRVNMRPKVAASAAADLESGWDGISNKSVREAFALDPCSLTFRDKELETEYMAVHSKLMRSPGRIYAIPLFAMVVMIMIIVSVLIPQEPHGSFYWAMLCVMVITPASFTGVILQKKFGGRNFDLFLVVFQVAMSLFVVFVVWCPFFQHWSGVCDAWPHEKANCKMIADGTAPFPALLITTMTPMILTTIFGLQWLPCCVIAVLVNCPSVYYLAVFQSAAVRLECATTFVVASFFGAFIAHVTTRQERETFVWRKVALSETKVELERTFNAFLCHEIRNPFAVIKGLAECHLCEARASPLITDQGDVAGEDGSSQFIHHIVNSCTHIQRILDNSLDLGRLEQHKLVLEDEVVNIKAICNEIYSMMSVRVKPGVRLVTTCPDMSFQGDRTRWLQLLLNLVSNSIKHTTSGFVRLDIGVETSSATSNKQQHVLCVKVSDTGCGISKAGQAVLFQKYQQVHQTGPWSPNKPSTDMGTGLGLVISQHLVFLMGSRSGISVQSPYCPGDSAGAMFSFSVIPKDLQFGADTPLIPTSSKQPSRVQHSPKILPMSSISNRIRANIMVVDDEQLNRMVLLSKLRQCEQGINDRLGAIGSDTAHSHTPGAEQVACHFSMEVVQAEHAEMALSMVHARVEARQKKTAGRVVLEDYELNTADAISEVDIDIIFLDQHMESSGGVLKGTDALPRFRQLAQSHDCSQPVIVLTSGNCSKADQERYTEMGADFAWPKPYPAGDAIADSISQWIRDRQPTMFA